MKKNELTKEITNLKQISKEWNYFSRTIGLINHFLLEKKKEVGGQGLEEMHSIFKQYMGEKINLDEFRDCIERLEILFKDKDLKDYLSPKDRKLIKDHVYSSQKGLTSFIRWYKHHAEDLIKTVNNIYNKKESYHVSTKLAKEWANNEVFWCKYTGGTGFAYKFTLKPC